MLNLISQVQMSLLCVEYISLLYIFVLDNLIDHDITYHLPRVVISNGKEYIVEIKFVFA